MHPLNENIGMSASQTMLRRGGRKLWVVLGISCLLASYYLPYWNLWLKAPQYPHGLKMKVYLNHVEGDTREVDLLNHYIGMRSLEDSAIKEKHYAWYVILLFSLGALLIFPAEHYLYRALFVPPILFFVGFIADLFYWLHRAGHDLSPDAPVHLRPFTPRILGEGKIGQFLTFAMFGSGFWLAVIACSILGYYIVSTHRKKISLPHPPG